MRDWRRHLYYRTECVKTTWKSRVGVLLLLTLVVVGARGYWTRQVVASLMCTSDLTPSDAILIENFDPDYLLFERAKTLQRDGLTPRIFVPVQAARDSDVPNLVSKAVVEVMANQARISAWRMISIHEKEPISLNAAKQVRDELHRQRVQSLTVLAPAFRSRRSALVYGAVMGREIHVRCDAVLRSGGERWTDSWHGIQNVIEEFLKLQYYRFYVLPVLLGSSP